MPLRPFPFLLHPGAALLVGLALVAGCGGGEPRLSDGLAPAQPGRLQVIVSGGAGAASIAVTGPGGYSASLGAGGQLTGLVPGSYQVAAAPVTVSGTTWAANPPLQSVTVPNGGSATATVSYAAITGGLALSVTGLPPGVSPVLTVTGPAGFSAQPGAAATLSGLEPGTYTVAAATVASGADGYAPSPASQQVLVAAGADPTPVTIAYRLSTGRLAVAFGGVPPGGAPTVTVSGPQGFVAQLTAGTTLAGLVPGTYAVSAGGFVVGAMTWAPSPASQVIQVSADPVPAAASVLWSPTTGALNLVTSGLGQGVAAAILVTGPAGYSRSVSGPELLTGLAPGSYTIAAAPVSAGGLTWSPTPSSQAVVIVAGATASAGVAWTLEPGSLAVTISGLPGGTAASVTVSGAGGFLATLAGSQTLTDLAPGAYTVTAAPVSGGGTDWQPTPASQLVPVGSGPATAQVSYAASTGMLEVIISGVAVPASVTVTGPGGFSQVVTASQALSGLVPGAYTVAAAAVASGGVTYQPTPATQQRTVSAGTTSSASVVYSASPGSLSVTITGLPGGVAAAVTLSGPGGTSQAVAGTQVIGGLAPGSYTLTAAAVTAGGATYQPAPASQQRTVTSGATATAAIAYTVVPGAISVGISGLPAGVNAAVTLSGPGGATHQVTGSQVVGGLSPGNWTVTATAVSSGGTAYSPVPSSQGVVVTSGATTGAAVAYSAQAGGATLNLRIEFAYLTQAIQRPDHGVELVAGRDAYLRVFAVANEANGAQPRVRVRLFHGGAEVQSWLLNAGSPAVTQVMTEGSLPSSWNVLVPGALVQPGLALLAEVDPEGLVAEADEADNRYPVGGTPMPVTVRTLLPFQIRLVPVLQSVNGLQGDVTPANAAGYLSELQAMMPVAGVSVDVRAVYTTNAGELQSGNGNGAWSTILSEVLALRNATDQSSRYYYGVVRTTYSSGIAGMGYVGSPGSSFKAAIGWDRSGSRAGVLAHELGHNFGRSHAPCGGPGNPDPNYPHLGGQIGAWGLDVATLAVKAPTTSFDLMGYCNSDWVSDYTWNAVVSFRAASPTGAPPAGAPGGGADDGLLVWGRITPAGAVLEPAFRVAPTGRPLPRSGAWRIEGRDAQGALLFAQPFDPEQVADLPGGSEQHFALVLDAGRARLDQVAVLRLVGPGGGAERRAGVPPAGPDADPVLSAPGAGRRRLTWDAARHPMALVRDPSSGEILSFARGGAIVLWSGARTLEVQFSDGVRVVRRRLEVQ